MNMPFGFNVVPTGRKRTKNLARMIERGSQNNGINNIEGGMMGFMGLPWMTRRWGGNGSSGPWQWMMPWAGAMAGRGGNGGGGGGNDPGTGGDDPGTGGDGNGGTGSTSWTPPQLLYPPPIGTGVQWRNTMKYGA